MLSPEIRLIGVTGIPEIQAGDSLGSLLAGAISRNAIGLVSGDIVVVAQKAVSKAEGRLLRLDEVRPGELAGQWAERLGKDPRLVEVILRESHRVVRMDRGRLIVESRHGFVCANAGVDTSNTPPGTVALLPADPDASAEALRQDLSERWGVPVGVIVSDTFGRPWREGLTNVALGSAGLTPLLDYRGQTDTFGQSLRATVVALADELAAAAELVMGKTRQIPAVVVRGVAAAGEGSGRDLLRAAEQDLFR